MHAAIAQQADEMQLAFARNGSATALVSVAEKMAAEDPFWKQIYPSTKDSDGKPLVGTNAYVIHFPKGQTPPAEGFWSITMYDTSYFFYPNPLNKQTVSMRDRPVLNPDGSLDLYFSHDKPAKAPEANWLPAPSDQFILMIQSAAVSSGVSIRRLTAKPISSKPYYFEMPFEIEADGRGHFYRHRPDLCFYAE